MKYINEEEKFWKHSFRVHLHEHDTEGLLINADHEQDALDYAVDYAEKQGWEGLFYSQEEIAEKTEQEQENLLFAGNHSRALSSSDYLRIEKID